MFWEKKLNKALENAFVLEFHDQSRFILFSDVHRGINDWSDDFAHNQTLFFFAINEYFKNGFTYIELGDGDELWENKHFSKIRQAHSHIFWRLREFYNSGRFHLIYGNHDIERRKPARVEKTLKTLINDITEEEEKLFDCIELRESIILKHKDNSGTILLLHGHQVDWISGVIWRFSRFIVRHFWKHMQLLGFRDLTSPAKNYKKAKKIDKKLLDWSSKKKQPLIAGHTHRSRIAQKTDKPYFNTGSCVHPRCITGLEIESGNITLIKWWFCVDEEDDKCNCMKVLRKELAPSRRLADFFGS
jgi:UDP-2,3-diacylglucosamine pyrophosphatase LpxH